MVPTYTTKKTRRYRYYETRRDLTGPNKPESTRYAMAKFDRHIIENLASLLADQHTLRHVTGLTDGSSLQSMFAQAKLQQDFKATNPQLTLGDLVHSIRFAKDSMTIELNPAALRINNAVTDTWAHTMPLPTKQPLREAKFRLSNGADDTRNIDPKLVALLANAMEAGELVLSSQNLPLNKIAAHSGRCRKKLTQLLKLSWISPRVVEAIVEGRQPAFLKRNRLTGIELPSCWLEQKRALGCRN